MQWTTDKNLEDFFSEVGKVKFIKFFEEKANGKSKGSLSLYKSR
jgi:RNA recognition motif-containing protein